MNELKYIPGDLVMTNGVPLGTAKDVVYRVTSSDPTKTLKLDDGTVLKGVVCLENIEGAEFGEKGYLSGDSCAWVKDIVPLPLTPEILEKNGWVKDTHHHCLDEIPAEAYKKKDFPLTYFNVTFGKKRIQASHDSLFVRNLKYVSDLQHLLFGLGINHEMEV